MAKKKTKAEIELDEHISREKLLESIATEINKGKDEAVIMVGDSASASNVPYWVLSGIPALDYAVGGYAHPGFPCGRFVEIFGAEGCGKSTLAIWIMKRAIDQIGAVAYHQDAEHVLTPEIIKGTNLNMALVMQEQPDTLESAIQNQRMALEKIVKTCPNTPVVTILDSVAACPTQAQVDGEIKDLTIGSVARVLSKGLSVIVPLVAKSSVLSIWVNLLLYYYSNVVIYNFS